MEATLLTLNKPNLNNRIYPADVVQKAIDNYIASGKPILVLDSFQEDAFRFGATNIERTVGQVQNLKIVGDTLMGDIEVFPGKEPLYKLSCRPAFIGKIEDNVITEAELLSFAFTAEPA